MSKVQSFAKHFDLSGRIFLVSGGAGLLGSQISAVLSEYGATVLIASRNKQNCVDMAAQLTEAFGNKAQGYTVDIGESGAVTALFDEIKKDYGRLDGLVNCSGFGKKNSWESISEEDWIYDINISLNGPFRMTKAAFPFLKDSAGIILNIGSMYGHIAPDYRMYDGDKYCNPPSYNAAKGGILQFNRYLASFLSPHGIRVNAICPGPFPYESTQKENPAFIERLAAKNPLNRIGDPEEIKGAALYLCSDASKYVTGENICVDGGWTIW
jgi:gluconate 5-dehydrogenase